MCASTIQLVTEPPAHHFFGYYDKSPWDRSEQYLLTHAVDFADRVPATDDEARICLVDTETAKTTVVDTTTAWNFQQGSMLQWVGPDYEQRILYNDREDGALVTRIRDIYSGESWTVSTPIYAPAPDGCTGFTLNFDRLHQTRQGYGYATSNENTVAPAPDDDGVYRVDMETGEQELLISLKDLTEIDPLDHMANVTHWVNHLQVSPNGDHVAFLHRWWTDPERTWHGARGRIDTDRTWHDRLYTMDVDGRNLNCLVSGGAGHYDWRTETKILADTLPEPGGERRFRWYDVDTGRVEPALPPGIRGHNSFSPDGRWILYDRTVETDDEQHLVLRNVSADPEADEYVDLGSVPMPAVENEDLRCDLHPRWDRSGRQVCFDSLHTGMRQMYVINVSEYVQPTYRKS